MASTTVSSDWHTSSSLRRRLVTTSAGKSGQALPSITASKRGEGGGLGGANRGGIGASGAGGWDRVAEKGCTASEGAGAPRAGPAAGVAPTSAELQLRHLEAALGEGGALEDVREGDTKEGLPVLRLLACLVNEVPPRPADSSGGADGRRVQEAEHSPKVVRKVHLDQHIRLKWGLSPSLPHFTTSRRPAVLVMMNFAA
eukprot:scaffold3149_cov118-Isochrysis_galbana.AAC.2